MRRKQVIFKEVECWDGYTGYKGKKGYFTRVGDHLPYVKIDRGSYVMYSNHSQGPYWPTVYPGYDDDPVVIWVDENDNPVCPV